ncbi:MAG: lipocalin-like domain-containing protein [Pseudomonadota bacterium]
MLRAVYIALLALLALPATAQIAIMGTEAEGYAEVRPETQITFPEDHGPHPDYRIEWWYITANLRDASGERLGIQWTLFRFATQPPPFAEGWARQQLWMGHAGVTTAAAHYHAETFGRGGIGTAGAEATPFRAWIDDWAFESTGEDFSPLSLSARGDDFAYALTLTAEGPMVFQGVDGYSVKSDRGQASHYVSQPYFRVTGEIEIEGALRQVTGRAWMDREWSSQPLAPDQTGWDWFSLHLGAGEKLMAFRLRSDTGEDYLTGNWISADGQSTRIEPGEITMTELGHTQIGARRVPTEWRLEIPSRGLDVETVPLNPRAWNAMSTTYWEGPVFFTGSHEGEGYLEMTGY